MIECSGVLNVYFLGHMEMFDSILIPELLESIYNFWHSPVPVFFCFVCFVLSSSLSFLTTKRMSAQCVPLLILCWLRNKEMKLVKIKCKARLKRDLVWAQYKHLSARHHFSSYQTSCCCILKWQDYSPDTGDVTEFRNAFSFFSNFTHLPRLLSLSHELFIISSEITEFCFCVDIYIRVLSGRRHGRWIR